MKTFTVGISTKMLMHQDYFHRDEVEELEKKNTPALEGLGEPLVITHSAYFSKQVFHITCMASLFITN